MAMTEIPDDTPKNTAKAIVEILQDEAAILGAQITITQARQKMSIILTITIELRSKSCRVILTFLPSEMLPVTSGRIGIGSMHGVKCWHLELLSKEIFAHPHEPPFQWGMFHEGDDFRRTTPRHILDGFLLRRWLHESLEWRLYSTGAPKSNSFC